MEAFPDDNLNLPEPVEGETGKRRCSSGYMAQGFHTTLAKYPAGKYRRWRHRTKRICRMDVTGGAALWNLDN